MAQEKFERFGNYILLEKLASGGMAEIHLSKKLAAEGVQKFVAVKRILAQHSSSEDFIRMFKDEAKIAVNLSHSNVVSIYDFGVENSQLYLVMDYVEGKNLRQILNRLKQANKRFSISHIVFITKMIAAGLDHAHRLIDATTGQHLNIIHRDMSPQNVMVSYEGEVKIIDFGIAKSTTQEESTRVGTLKGKFGYMSPEQVDGLEVDARTDIFALGIMLWEMLSEQRLFLTNNEMSTLRKIRDCKIPSLREIDPNIPVELEKIVNRSLARNKTQRYQSAAEFQKDLQSFLNRYNPDFSNQDFAEFIKDVYAAEIVEARKRQVAYSKVDVPHLASTQLYPNDNRMDNMTQSMTFSKRESENINFVDLELQKGGGINEGSQPHLTISQPAFMRQNPATMAGSKPRPLAGDRSAEGMNKSYTNSKIKVPTAHEEESSSAWLGILIVAIAGVVGLFAVVNETQPKLVASQCQMVKGWGVPLNCYEAPNKTLTASKDKENTLLVTSEPEGAAIYLNAQPTGLKTPANLHIDDQKSFAISVSLGGYKNETQRFPKFPLNTNVFFRLSSIPSGTVIIKVIGGEATLNGQKVTNGQRMLVEARRPLKFKVYSPLTKAERETVISVQANETKEVILSPH